MPPCRIFYLSSVVIVYCCTGARFGFTLDEELKQDASCEEVRVALGEKISRERIGNEVCIWSSWLQDISLFRCQPLFLGVYCDATWFVGADWFDDIWEWASFSSNLSFWSETVWGCIFLSLFIRACTIRELWQVYLISTLLCKFGSVTLGFIFAKALTCLTFLASAKHTWKLCGASFKHLG